MAKRLDVLLVELNLARSRSHAQALIEAKQVIDSESKRTYTKASQTLSESQIQNLQVVPGSATKFVSRGGLKLEAALSECGIEVQGKVCLDVGSSTGGFSDCLLQKKAKLVVGVDVGHKQIAESLLANPNFINIEGINARDLSSHPEFGLAFPKGGFDLIVMDVSFISIGLILPQLLKLLSSEGQVLSLVKPQFEVGPEHLAKGGLVKDPLLFVQLEDKVKSQALRFGYKVIKYFSSAIEGKDGNREFFILLSKPTL